MLPRLRLPWAPHSELGSQDPLAQAGRLGGWRALGTAWAFRAAHSPWAAGPTAGRAPGAPWALPDSARGTLSLELCIKCTCLCHCQPLLERPASQRSGFCGPDLFALQCVPCMCVHFGSAIAQERSTKKIGHCVLSASRVAPARVWPLTMTAAHARRRSQSALLRHGGFASRANHKSASSSRGGSRPSRKASMRRWCASWAAFMRALDRSTAPCAVCDSAAAASAAAAATRPSSALLASSACVLALATSAPSRTVLASRRRCNSRLTASRDMDSKPVSRGVGAPAPEAAAAAASGSASPAPSWARRRSFRKYSSASAASELG
mmetsp:Transcript_3405/g.14031  ORF Transcript_3405/g.14031 Transcript_3405/m.14031 type:complete len:322 (-) Transcript_3405:103-1068(-)